MREENIKFLEDNKHHYETLIKALYMRSLSAETRQRMQDIIRQEWEPTYHTDLWCPPCISDMIRKVYGHYNEWLAQQPVKVEANFPSNKTD